MKEDATRKRVRRHRRCIEQPAIAICGGGGGGSNPSTVQNIEVQYFFSLLPILLVFVCGKKQQKNYRAVATLDDW